MTLPTKLLGVSAASWLAAMAVGGAAIIVPEAPAPPIRYDADGHVAAARCREWAILGAGSVLCLQESRHVAGQDVQGQRATS